MADNLGELDENERPDCAHESQYLELCIGTVTFKGPMPDMLYSGEDLCLQIFLEAFHLFYARVLGTKVQQYMPEVIYVDGVPYIPRPPRDPEEPADKPFDPLAPVDPTSTVPDTDYPF